MKKLSLTELSVEEIQEINGGALPFLVAPWAVKAATAGGLIALGNEGYKFYQGAKQGWYDAEMARKKK